MDPSTEEKPEASLVRAAQYIRMSTEHQQYSTANQGDVVKDYAKRRGFEIVRTYADEGKSGLRVEGRESLKKLIADVETGENHWPFCSVPCSECAASLGLFSTPQ